MYALTTNLCTKSGGDEYFGSYSQLKSNLVQGTRTATATWRRNARNILQVLIRYCWYRVMRRGLRIAKFQPYPLNPTSKPYPLNPIP